MRPSVRPALLALNRKLEGVCSFMYLDVGANSGRGRGLVTTGIGNLCPLAVAVTLPWRHPDGSFATQSDISDAWWLVDSQQEMRKQGGGAFAKLTRLRLDDEGIDRIVGERVALNDAHLARYFPHLAEWPADAQLLVHSMAWAAGGAFAEGFPIFTANANANDWDAHVVDADGNRHYHCHLEASHNPGLVPRNDANVIMAENATRVVAAGGDPSVLYWPKSCDQYPVTMPVREDVPVVDEDSRPIFLLPEPDADVKPAPKE